MQNKRKNKKHKRKINYIANLTVTKLVVTCRTWCRPVTKAGVLCK